MIKNKPQEQRSVETRLSDESKMKAATDVSTLAIEQIKSTTSQ